MFFSFKKEQNLDFLPLKQLAFLSVFPGSLPISLNCTDICTKCILLRQNLSIAKKLRSHQFEILRELRNSLVFAVIWMQARSQEVAESS